MSIDLKALVVASLAFCGCTAFHKGPNMPNAEFHNFEPEWKTLQSKLIGDWTARTETGAVIKASYKVISNNSALLETYTNYNSITQKMVSTERTFIEIREDT